MTRCIHLAASFSDRIRKIPTRMSSLSAFAILLAWAGVCQATGTGYLFVSSEKDHSITVLDGENYEVVKRIRTAARPRHLQFTPDRSRIFAACGEGNAIDIIDVASLTLIDRIEGIDDPEAFEFSPDGKTMYISLEDDAKLGILDLDAYFRARKEKPDLTVAEISDDDEAMDEDDEDEEEEGDEGDDEDERVVGMTTVEVGEEPEGILVSPDGKTVFITSEVANMVHVVDTATGALKANIVAGTRPRRFALMPDGKTLWVTNELSGSISVIDLEGSKVVDTISFEPRGFRPEDVTPVGITTTSNGATAYVALGRANHVAVVDIASKRIEDYILVGSRAWNTTLNRSESRLFVANGLSDDISIIDTASNRVLRSIPVGRVPYAVLIDD